jgi:hypothetical protein
VDFDVLKVTHGFSYAIGTAQYPMKQQRYRGDANNGCAPALLATMWRSISPLFLVGVPCYRGGTVYFRALAGIIATRFLQRQPRP